MNNRNSKIILEDHQDDFSYKKSKSNLDLSFNRVSFIFFIFFIIFFIYSIHLIHLGSRNNKSDNTNNFPTLQNSLYRADIIDINGNYLAKKIESNLTNKKFFYFEKMISDENYEKIMKLGDKSIQPEEKLTRIYPEKNLFSHIIGQIDNDNNGISGLEKSLDNELKNLQEPIKLTVDKDIQFLIRNELLKFNQIFKTKGSAAILMDVNNGEILSLVSLPDFDPNKRETISDINLINRATKGVYEFGSVFKTFTLAAALDEKIIEPETEYNDLPKSLTCAGFPIREYDDKIPSDLTAEQILIRSGNIGSVRIGQQIGEEKFRLFLSKIGILEKINFDIEEVGKPIKFNWGKCPLATASFGHGITTTLLQLAKAYAIIVNGGYQISPTIIKKSQKEKKEKILDQEVSEKILPILRKIVNTKEGTASLANVNGYEIGGKTGTAQKSTTGGYSKKKINSFISVFPTSSPKFVLAVMLDEPKTNQDYVYHYRDGSNIKYKGTPYNTAGWTTVETTGQIVEKIGPILATKYSEIN